MLSCLRILMKKSRYFLCAALCGAVGLSLTGCEKPAPAPSHESHEPQKAPAQTSATATPAAAPSAEKASTAEPTAPATDSAVALQDPVAVVNGEPIAKAELETALQDAVKGSGMDPATLTSEQKMDAYRQILDDLIIDKLITKAAADVQVDQEEVNAELAKIKTQFPSEEEFAAQLATTGQTPEKLSEMMTKLMRQRQWIKQQIGKDVEVTEADAQKFYDENKSEFEHPEQVKASHILFLVKANDSEEVAKSQHEKAKAALAKAKAKGADFSAVAKELSEEPGAKQSGGELGYFSKERMVPEFSEAAFALKTGQISEPVKTQFGWHVIKLEDRKAAGVTPFEEVKEQVKAYLEGGKQRKAIEGLIAKLRGSAKIESTLPPAPAEPDSASGSEDSGAQEP